jgi:hypothetical protein
MHGLQKNCVIGILAFVFMSLIGCNSGPLDPAGVLNDVQQKLEITGKTTVNVGDEVSLTVNILDPELAAVLDAVDPTYDWRQVSGPVVDIDDPSAAAIHFTAPPIDDTLANVLLIVTVSVDDVELSEAVKVTIFGSTSTEPAPTADAGSDLEVFAGDSVFLDGLNSTHPDGAKLEYLWEQTAGPDVDLVDADAAVASFIAPSLEEDTTLTFSLLVTVGQAQSIDYVDVTVFGDIEAASVDVVVDAGEDLEVDAGQDVLLDGSKSYSLDDGEVIFSWSQTAGMPVVLVDADKAIALFTAPEIESENETLVFLLTMEADDLPASKSLTAAKRVFTDEKQVKINKGQSDDAPGQGGGGGGSSPPPPTNNPPTVSGQNKGTIKNNGVTITLNGSDADNDNLTFSVVTGPAHGTLGSINNNGATSATVGYTANANFVGVDSFDVKANDGTADSNTATVTVNVYPEVEFTLSALDGPRPLAVTLSANTIGGDPLPDGTYMWTVDGVEDSGLKSTHNQRNVVFNTAGQHTVSLALTLAGISGAIGCNSAQTGGLAGFATVLPQVSGFVRDGNGNGISGVTVIATNSGGATSVTGANGDYLLTVPFNWTGNIQPQHVDWSFSPTALSHASLNDDVSNQNFSGSASGAGNIAPVANAQSVQTDMNVPKALTLTGSDANNDPLTYALVTNPSNGVLTGTPPNVTYTPNNGFVGVDGFLFRTNDGTANSNNAPVTITVAGNTAPTANSFSVQVTQNSNKSITLSGSDADNDPLAFFVVTNPANGALTGTAPNLTYTPTNGYSGADSFTYKANDGAIDSSAATVSLNVVALGAWTPPIGIPTPPFGITETAPAHPNNWQTPVAGFYYVDRYNGAATDSSNPYGSIGAPRQTIPNGLPAGAVVEIYGTYDFNPGGKISITGNGTAGNPIFIRGKDSNTKATITRKLAPKGNYQILENLELVDQGVFEVDKPFHHIALRHSEARNIVGSFGRIGSSSTNDGTEWLEDIVLYDNQIHEVGDWTSPDEKDWNGVIVQRHARRVWIIDNEIYHCQGDAVAVNTSGGTGNYPAQYVYIGRNRMYETQENAVDMKICYDVIISQNEMYEFRDTPGADPGQTIVVHNDQAIPGHPNPDRIWIMFNRIHHADAGVTFEGVLNGFFVGNVVHDIIVLPTSRPINANSAFGRGAAVRNIGGVNVTMANNTVYHCDYGLTAFGGSSNNVTTFYNNVIANMSDSHQQLFGTPGWHLLTDDVRANQMSADHNLFYESNGTLRINWHPNGSFTSLGAYQTGSGQGAGSIAADPKFVNPAGNDFHLQGGSPAIDAGKSPDFSNTFLNTYGIGISSDLDGNAWPQGTGYNMGPYE